MKLPISLKLALNYLRPNKSTVSIINIISTLGVLLGVAVLIIVLSIMNGFGQTWKEKILSVNAHINLLPSTEASSSWKHTVDYVSTFKEVEYVMPIIDSFALMQLDNNIGTPILDLKNFKNSFVIIEASSFQLSHSKFICPDYALFLNFSRIPSHLKAQKFLQSSQNQHFHFYYSAIKHYKQLLHTDVLFSKLK